MFRKAEETDLDSIEKSYTDLLLWEAEHGTSSNWRLGVYPTRADARRALDAGTLWVLEESGQVCASLILNDLQAADYEKINWLFPALPEKVRVIHTLCISPEKARRGYGRAIVQAAIEEARLQGAEVLRLDTWEGNKPAAALYTGCGCRIAGSLHVLHMGFIDEVQIFLERRL